MERGGAAVHADGVLAALPFGELLLELHALGAGPVVDFAGAQHLLNGLHRVIAESRPTGERVRYRFRAAVYRQLVTHDFSSRLCS